MAVSGSQQITHLLLGWGQGDQTALEALMPLVYDELRKVAARHLCGSRRSMRVRHRWSSCAISAD
jgi:hypothetical protein